MVSVSLCMIVKNEEKVLKRCLDSIKDVVDEIIIVDTGSTDKTKEIAKKYTNKLYDFVWVDDFAKARNYSFSKATSEYILWLDADDVLPLKEKQKFIDLKNSLNKNVDIVTMKYELFTQYSASDKNDTRPSICYYRERLIKNDKTHIWHGAVHEVLDLTGIVQKTDIRIIHKKIYDENKDEFRNLNIYKKQLEKNVVFTPRDSFYFARELMYAKEYEKSIKYYIKVIEDEASWVENKVSACIDVWNILNIQGKRQKALEYLFKTFLWVMPRAEVCSYIAKYFLDNKEYMKAIYWYEIALKDKLDTSTGGFYAPDFYDYVPYVNMSICYFNIGNIPEALNYISKAEMVKPDDKLVEYNKKIYLEKKKLL